MDIQVSLKNNENVSGPEFARDFKDESRAFFDIVLTGGATLLVLVILALALRATEIFITSQSIIAEARAATIPTTTYNAKMMVRTGETITMTPGERKTYMIGFKNTGTAVWKNNGANFVSVYTMDPKYRRSVFYDSSWRLAGQPSAMKDASVPTGTIGYFEFILRAPQTQGTYNETFQIAAEDLTWIDGGKFFIEIKVTSAASQIAPPVASPSSNISPTPTSVTNTSNGSSSGDYNTVLLLRSYKGAVEVGPREVVTMIFGFKNNGSRPWQIQSLKNTGTQIAVTDNNFRHISWIGPDEAARVNQMVNPGEIGYINFTIQAPNNRGSYQGQFKLVVDGVDVPGGEVDIPVTVTSDGAESSAPAIVPEAFQTIPEPELRVGLFKTRTPILITASSDYDIWSNHSRLVETVLGGQPTKVIFDFDYRTYTVTTTTQTYVLNEYVRFLPHDGSTIFTVPSYTHPTGWNQSLNDNRFRGKLEIHYAENTGNLWIINELPIEMYLRGLAETSNSSHFEFQKALVSVARTYAFYHFLRNTKHGGHFHVDAEFDQVYRGYGNEIRTPNVTRAVEETRGNVVAYNNEIVITPYYSRSDGRTRAWEEVWGGGPKPWLPSVPTPYDAGKTLWGHGVGMSARDAVFRAEDGTPWDQIVKYYYRGVDLQKRWN